MDPIDGALSWRPLTESDLPQLQQWLRDPLVARWWNHQTSDDALERDFGPSVRGEEAGQDLVVSVDGIPVGLIQRSRIADYAEDAAELRTLGEIDDEAMQLDYLIGDPAHRGRGLGPRIIAALIADTWRRHPDAPAVFISIVAGNKASWRAAEKAGLTRIAEGNVTPDNPIDDPLHYLYRIDRPSWPRGMPTIES